MILLLFKEVCLLLTRKITTHIIFALILILFGLIDVLTQELFILTPIFIMRSIFYFIFQPLISQL